MNPPNPRRELPAVHAVVALPALAGWLNTVPRSVVTSAVREALADWRVRLASCPGELPPSIEQVGESVAALLERRPRFPLPEAINGKGILIHTGLGRAPLSASAIAAIEAAAGYTPLEIDPVSGQRSRRSALVSERLCALTGAESATIVNNNAAALLIALNTFASGKEVLVSRGELIEIGGGFRLPEIMAASGAKLREVGTTNRTRLEDFSRAMSPDVGAILAVHPSNYRVVGFTEAAPINRLAALGHEHGVPVLYDIGSGALQDMTFLGLGEEPTAKDAWKAGVDLALFSGDKLIGGPQAGYLVGRREMIERIERNPLMRALRVDKLTLAAAAATLDALLHSDVAIQEVPLWAMIATTVDQLRARASEIASKLIQCSRLRMEIVSTQSQIGGGALPGQELPSVALALASEAISEEELARRLRIGQPPVFGRLQEGRVLIDLRSVLPRQDQVLCRRLLEACDGGIEDLDATLEATCQAAQSPARSSQGSVCLPGGYRGLQTRCEAR